MGAETCARLSELAASLIERAFPAGVARIPPGYENAEQLPRRLVLRDLR